MANPSRGEVDVTIGGQTYTIRPSFQVIREIEGAVGPIFAVAKRLGEGNLGITESATILWLALRRTGGAEAAKLTLDAVGEEFLTTGYTAMLAPLGDFLARAVSPGKDLPTGESRAKTLN